MHLSQHDLYTGFIAIAAIAIVLFCIEFAVKTELFTKLLGRKLLHFTAICTCAYCIHQFENRLVLAFIFLLFFFILLGVIRKGWMQVNDYKTYGIAFFPLAFSALLFIPVFSLFEIVYAVLILAISDALAGIFGEYFGRKKIIFLFENKSWVGFSAFYISAFALSLFYLNNYSFHGFLLCTVIALLPAITELFSHRGSDNFTVPLFTASWALLILKLDTNQLQSLLLILLLFSALSIIAFYKKWLTVSGAVAACWMAMLLFITGGYKAFIAPGIFLISGSLLSKFNKHQYEKEGRNGIQVFANGITGIVFMIFFGITQQNIYLITAIISFCISMSDSVSSEIGMYFKGITYDILTFKKISPGLSGGISIPGTLAGLAGAVLLSYSVGYFYNFSLLIIIFITGAGFTGMLADSVLGSWLQVKYKNVAGEISETATFNTKKVKGYSWCTNDTVNILSNLLITVVFFYILRLII
jgi:uncharacterized protein (TIGR00297 family)